MTNTKKRQIQRQRQNKFQKEWVHVYRFHFPVLMYIDAEMSLAHVDTYCPLQDKDKDKDKDKDNDKDTHKDKDKDKGKDKGKDKDKDFFSLLDPTASGSFLASCFHS